MYSIICGSAPFLPMFALISRNAGFNYCLTIFDASLPIRMVLRREILYLTHLIGKYRARLGIFCSDLMEQKREEGKGRRARQIYSKPLLIIDRRHIWSLFASKLDGWKRTPLVTYSFLTRFYLFYISKWIKNLKDLRYINFYHKVLSNKSNTLCNNLRRKIYNSVICYRYINIITESLYFAYIYSNHLVINQLGTRTCPNTLHKILKKLEETYFLSSYFSYLFKSTSQLIPKSSLHTWFSPISSKKSSSKLLLPHRSPTTCHYHINTYIDSPLPHLPIIYRSICPRLELGSETFHQKIRRNFDRLGEPASIRYPARMNRGGENRWTVAFGDGLHGVSTTETPRRSHTLRNQSFHCPCRAHIPQPAL